MKKTIPHPSLPSWRTSTYFAFLLLLLTACGNDDQMILPENDAILEGLITDADPAGKAAFILPESNDYANIPQDPNNPITDIKVLLGKQLFHETGIGLNPMVEEAVGTFSCASCHFAEAGFQANRFQGIGEGGEGFFLRGPGNNHASDQLDVQPIRTPTAMNGAYQDVMLWNGQFGGRGTNEGTQANWTPDTPKENNNFGYEGLETQAIAGLGVHRLVIDQEYMEANSYADLFEAAFPNRPATEKITVETAALAIAAYERTLLANQSPWQRYLRGGRDMLSEEEKLGAIVFFGKGGCVSCHSGPSLATMSFHVIGMEDLDRCPEETFGTSPDNVENFGRGGFTGNESEMFAFKTPQLYNLSDSPFYGHGASFRSVREVVEYKNAGIAQNDRVPAGRLSPHFQPLGLSETEIDNLTTFLEQSLRDDNLLRYVPQALLSGNCFPNSDEGSRFDRGCD
ncbi:cytochrome-c peroxidase [Lewinellaceae bacterium SD302]|nr:cytochrome-c peroxidase [Lewinellaceae bacterium SD302]